MVYRFRLVDGSIIETDGHGVADALKRAKAAYRLEHDRKRTPEMTADRETDR